MKLRSLFFESLSRSIRNRPLTVIDDFREVLKDFVPMPNTNSAIVIDGFTNVLRTTSCRLSCVNRNTTHILLLEQTIKAAHVWFTHLLIIEVCFSLCHVSAYDSSNGLRSFAVLTVRVEVFL